MSDSLANLRRKISGAGQLRSVVRTMKAVAAANIGQYEKSVHSLVDYNHTVELGLGACFRATNDVPLIKDKKRKMKPGDIGVVVFGSDQGLVGQFNNTVVEFAINKIASLSVKPVVWAVGERVHAHLKDENLPLKSLLPVPTSVNAITFLIGQILAETESPKNHLIVTELHLFYNHPTSGSAFIPITIQLLPLDDFWRKQISKLPWPNNALPQVMDQGTTTLRALVREYLFVSLFRACAESLASENASRLAAMQRADKNIDELLERLSATFHRVRQSGIDEELFDVVSGFEALSKDKREK